MAVLMVFGDHWSPTLALNTAALSQSYAAPTNSNLNTYPLPDGWAYLVHNPVVPANGKTCYRDPITIATAKDGYSFDTV